MLRWLRRLHSAGDPAALIGDAGWSAVLSCLATVAPAGGEQRAQWRALSQQFLRSKSITPVAGLELTPADRELLAALATRPVLDLGLEWLRGWSQLIVYPGQFGVRRQHHDEGTGVVSEWDDELSGEAWDRGPVIVSWADVRQDVQEPAPGFAVLAHEIAHKLDALDGVMDGTPPLRPGMSRRGWVEAFTPAYESLCAQVDAGDEPAIDGYAAEGPDEFFAVVTEYHFSAPDLLAEAMPAVAGQLTEFYGPPPGAPGSAARR